ncbi:unnamed protein product [Cuscuta epithymum]|uniref:Uncharacterized protein n=2 Tax=Cuscuta epithymum TaxID=186058 RepID=A0AAV0CHN5_9ASTE|nr:unnamed protein product [Cuscuta epithymum]
MAITRRTRRAYKAMKAIGISRERVKPVLNNLLKIYKNNWRYIEEENYRALADAVFESAEPKQGALEGEILPKDLEQPHKRLWSQYQGDQPSSCYNPSSTLAEASQKNGKVKDDAVSIDCCTNESPDMMGSLQSSHVEMAVGTSSHSLQMHDKNKGKEPISPESLVMLNKSVSTQPASLEKASFNSLKKAGRESSSHPMRLRSKQREPQDLKSASRKKKSRLNLKDTKNQTCPVQSAQQNNFGAHVSRENKDVTLIDDMPDFKVPIAVFPLESSDDDGVQCGNGHVGSNGTKDEIICIASSSSDMKTNQKLVQQLSPHSDGANNESRSKEDASQNNHCIAAESGHSVSEHLNSPSPEAVESFQLSPDNTSTLYKVIDITKKQERITISLVNEVNSKRPPSFHYISESTVFRNAHINISLDRIGDDHSCSTCSGDCLSLTIPCACSYETGGEFAYTREGVVKEQFLKECISMNRDPEKHCQYYCTVCPHERSKSTVDPCKGHLVRNFIKECWRKCGCDMHCGNRVVQRGITRMLQVFMTPGGKGWGLRTLEDLPKGAFVCEYVGEVLTNSELFDRISRSSGKEKHFYPVLLDADWAAEGVLKDEEALCLDATYYGNVARFINHRCFDSNLVEIPVEIETPDHHYYHLAFFTTREVKAREELTWDYGIDFGDHKHPIKAFKCQCGSTLCRNIKRLRPKRVRRWTKPPRK